LKSVIYAALAILQKYWKHDKFRSLQKEIIDSVLSGQDTFALMPTGGEIYMFPDSSLERWYLSGIGCINERPSS
jgi:hypothetical protein